MVLYSNFLRLNSAVATSTNLLTDRLHVNQPLVDGYLALSGATSGHVNLQAAATTTTYTFTFPADTGAPGQFLQTDGSGGASWETVSLTPTLDEVYGNDADGSNAVITTTATDGSVEIAGTEGLVVSGAKGLYIQTNTDFDGYVKGNGFSNAWLNPIAAGDIKTTGDIEGYGNIAIHSNNNSANSNYFYVQNGAETIYSSLDQVFNGGTIADANLSAVSTSGHAWLQLRGNSAATSTATLEATDNVNLTSLNGDINLTTAGGLLLDGYLIGNSFNDAWLTPLADGDIKTNGNLEIKGNIALIKEVAAGTFENYIDVGDTGLTNYYTEFYQHYNATSDNVVTYLLAQDNVNGRIGSVRLDTTSGQPRVNISGQSGNVDISTTTSGNITLNATDDIILSVGTGDDLTINVGGSPRLVVNGTNSTSSNHILPSGDNTLDLGSASFQWNELYVGTAIRVASGGGVENTTASATLNVGTGGNTTTLNLGTGTNTNVINIGTGSGATTINLGGASDTVNIAGTLTYVNTTNLEVTDKLITVNKGGALASGNASGIAIEENGIQTGFALTGNSRASWDFIAPDSDGTIRLTPTVNPFTAEIDGYNLTDNRTYLLPDQSGTFALQGALIVDLESEVTGILPLANGGTEANLSTATPGSLIYVDSTPAMGFSSVGTTGQPIVSGGALSPTWFTAGVAGEVVKSISGVLSTSALDLTTEVGSSILPLANGGTNKNMTAINGGIVWTDADSMEVTAAGTSGQPLLSGGAGSPTWFSSTGVVKATSGVLSVSNVSLTTEVTGILPLANGGTNKNMTASAGAVAYSDADSLELTAVGTSEQVLKSNGASAPAFADPDKLFVSLTNNTGSTITAGSVVILSQSTAGEIQLADASALATCEGVVGVVQSNILNTASGRVQIAGRCTPTQDASFSLGQRVYVSETAGSSTSTAPSAVGTVIFVLGYAVSTTDVILNMRLEAVN